MRVSFSSGTFYHRALRYSLELARDAGYDGVEAVLGPGYLARGVEPWRQAIQQTGVPVLSSARLAASLHSDDPTGSNGGA